MYPTNPFIVVGKIPAKYFCDRKEESSRIIRDIVNGNNVVIISSRRMGKTGLIQHCFENPELSDNFETFYLDILQTSSMKEFTYLLGREIFSRLASKRTQRLRQFTSFLKSLSGCFGFDPLNGIPTFNLQLGDITEPELTIDEIFQFLASSEIPSIVAIDEFQQIATYKERNVEAILRTQIQRLSNAKFIFSGSERHLLHQMFTESAKPFYNSASILELNAIPVEIYSSFANELFEERGKHLEDGCVRWVSEIFEGNTFYIQKTFNIAFAQTPSNGTCNKTIINYAIEEMLASFDTIYREILSRMGESPKQLLIALAQTGTAHQITSASFIRKHALVSSSSVQASTRRLLSEGFLIRQGNSYKLQDPLLRQWLLSVYGK